MEISTRPVGGRNPAEESRGTEFRLKLVEWKQTSEPLRPSLRALARMLGTSHQLLKHYLNGLEKWRYKEQYRKATEEADQILAGAIVESRPMTPREEEQCHACAITAIRAKAGALLLDELKKLKREARRGPLHPAQFKMVKIFAKQGFPGTQELLQKCSQVGLKVRKRFAETVKEAPRQEGETDVAWVRRIRGQCDKYDTKRPAVITVELLEKCSQSRVNSWKNNLPPISASAAKSFRRA
jgi:hypothetical protein